MSASAEKYVCLKYFFNESYNYEYINLKFVSAKNDQK